MAPAGAHESLRTLSMDRFEFDSFNKGRLMAEKAMHDRDYRTQPEHSADGHDELTELFELDVEIDKGMAAHCRKHIDDEKEAWADLRCRTYKVDKTGDMEALRATATMSAKDRLTRLRETNVADTTIVSRVWEADCMFTGTASSTAGRPLTLLAAGPGIQPFQLMKLPTELREEVYREILMGREQTIVVSKSSIQSRPCSFERPRPRVKDITTALLRTSRGIYNEALPVLYRSHVFDFGVNVHRVASFFDKISSAGRQNVHGIHMELLRYEQTNHPMRSVPKEDMKDNCRDWSSACVYIAKHVRVKEVSFNISCSIHDDFQRFSWVQDLAQIHVLNAVFHHNSPNKDCLKPSQALVMPAKQMSRDYRGTDEYRWEALLEYLRSEMLH